jgi:hypothetical protein
MERLADVASYQKLPEDPKERQERFLEFFGQDLMGFRNDALRNVYQQLEHSSWDTLLPYDRDFFGRAATLLSAEQREVSRKLTERVITIFMERMMTMLTAGASNQPLGEEHGLRYRLSVEVQHCPRQKPTERYRRPREDEDLEVEDFEPPDAARQSDPDSPSVLETHKLTEGAKLHFPKYWHRWMSRYGSY